MLKNCQGKNVELMNISCIFPIGMTQTATEDRYPKYTHWGRIFAESESIYRRI